MTNHVVTQLFALALTAQLAAAQATDTIFVGKPGLRSANAQNSADTTEVFAERDGQSQKIATGIQYVSQTADRLVVVFVNDVRGGRTIDSVTLSAVSLAPFRHVEVFPGVRAAYEFRDGRLVGTRADSAGQRQVDVPVQPNRFDFSAVELVRRTLPFRPGYQAVIMAFDVASRKERAVTVRVVGRERISWRGSETDAWKLISDYQTHEVTSWVDVETRRQLKWEIVAPNMRMSGVLK